MKAKIDEAKIINKIKYLITLFSLRFMIIKKEICIIEKNVAIRSPERKIPEYIKQTIE